MRLAPLLGLLLIVASCGTPNTSRTSAPSDGEAMPPASPAGTQPPPAGELDGLVAYVGGADPQIYLLDLGSGESRQLTQLRAEDADLTGSGPMRPVLTCGFGPSGLQWAPDGSRLAFAYGGCDGVVHVVDLDGTLQRIGDGQSPAWSPDGSQLAFGSNHLQMAGPIDGAWPLMVVDMAGGDMTPRPLGDVADGFYAGAPSYSRDGAMLAFTGPLPGAEDPTASAAYVMRSDGADLALVAGPAVATGWLPDGRLIVIEPMTGRSSAVDLATGEFTPLAGGDPVEGVSPDGSLLLASAFVAERNRVRLYGVDGDLVGEIGGFAPSWNPDGTAFLVNDVEASTLLVVGTDGTELGSYQLVAPAGGDYRARWQPTPPTP